MTQFDELKRRIWQIANDVRGTVDGWASSTPLRHRPSTTTLKKIFSDNELAEESVIRKFRITAADGKNYNTSHYNLSAIIAVGYKVNSERAVQFRKCYPAKNESTQPSIQNEKTNRISEDLFLCGEVQRCRGANIERLSSLPYPNSLQETTTSLFSSNFSKLS